MPIRRSPGSTTSLAVFILPLIASSVAGCSNPQFENIPPYACKVIPHHVFELTVDSSYYQNSSIEVDVVEGSMQQPFYSCVAEKGQSRVGYQQWQGARVSEGRKSMESWGTEDVEYLPPKMGEGWIDGSTGWVRWRCNDKPVLSRISRPGERDRDRIEDVTRLLEIAQQRYAELNDCEIRPPK